jgi:hypothetical protein
MDVQKWKYFTGLGMQTYMLLFFNAFFTMILLKCFWNLQAQLLSSPPLLLPL